MSEQEQTTIREYSFTGAELYQLWRLSVLVPRRYRLTEADIADEISYGMENPDRRRITVGLITCDEVWKRGIRYRSVRGVTSRSGTGPGKGTFEIDTFPDGQEPTNPPQMLSNYGLVDDVRKLYNLFRVR